MIMGFLSREAEKIWRGLCSSKLPIEIQDRSLKKLRQLNAVTTLDDLKVPPSNHLEKLKGTRQGQHSIRINGQWRICFEWNKGHAYRIEIVDYH